MLFSTVFISLLAITPIFASPLPENRRNWPRTETAPQPQPTIEPTKGAASSKSDSQGFALAAREVYDTPELYMRDLEANRMLFERTYLKQNDMGLERRNKVDKEHGRSVSLNPIAILTKAHVIQPMSFLGSAIRSLSSRNWKKETLNWRTGLLSATLNERRNRTLRARFRELRRGF